MSSNRSSWGGWVAVLAALAVPVLLAAQSPYLAWRQPVYIVAGFAGIVAFAGMVVQPMLAARLLPVASVRRAQTLHRWTGVAVLGAVVLHVVALWITSPPDVVDALLLRSPTPFSAWGVLATWAVGLAAGIALSGRRLIRGWRRRRQWHASLSALAVGATVLHVVLIDGTMEPVSKVLLCLAALAVLGWAMVRLRLWSRG